MTSVTQNMTARLTKARTDLLLSHPFFGSLLFRLPSSTGSPDSDHGHGWLALFYNPSAVASLKHAELVFVLAHEVMHPALQHHTRRGSRDPRIWNMACDHSINPLLVEAGLFPPVGILLDDRFRGMSAEQIYALLAQEEQERGGSDSQAQPSSGPQEQTVPGSPESDRRPVPKTPGGFGQVLDAPNPDTPHIPATPDQLREQEREWRVAVQQAHQAARLAGKCPAGVDRALESAEEASVDWREALRRCFSETLLVDYTWSRPNRRFLASGLYLPGPQKEGAGELAIAVDCSGSIESRTLSLFAAEVSSLVEENHPQRVHVLYFDTEVQRADTFECGQPITLEPKGGGGTDFRPVFEYLASQHIEPHAVIFLTDLCGAFLQQEPLWPVIWASTEKRQAPFGATVYLGAA